MTVEIHSCFEIVMKCVHLKVFLHMDAWRGRALFTFVCTIVMSSRMHSNVLSEEGDVELRLVIPIQMGVILFKWLHGLNAIT